MLLNRINGLNNQQGFTLIEVLSALIILAIGLLGLASLHAVGLRNNHDAYLKTQAIMLAYDMVDRIRANQGWTDADGDGQKDDYAYNYRMVTALTHADCIKATGCDQKRIAENDVWEWQSTLQSVLPGGVGTLCTDSNLTDSAECDPNGNVYMVKIQWNDVSTGKLNSFKTTFRPIITPP